MHRDVAHFAATKLADEWSARNFASSLSAETLQLLTQDHRFGKLEPMVKVRLLLSTLFLTKQVAAELQPELGKLAAAAREDDDEWVRVMGCAAVHMDGKLDLAAVMRESSVVEDTITQLQARLGETQEASFCPTEEKYLSSRVLITVRPSTATAVSTCQHFRLRDGVVAEPGELIAQKGVAGGAQEATAGTIGAAGPQEVPLSTRHKQTEAGTDMFRSSKPINLTRPVTAAMNSAAQLEKAERKGAARTIKTKTIEIDEVVALHKATDEQLHSPRSRGPQDAPFGGRSDAEAGELPPSPPAKRARNNATL